MSPTEKMVTDRAAVALRQLIATATGARKRRLEARLAEVVAYAAGRTDK